MVNCGVCVQSISGKQPSLLCQDCKREFHGACLKFSRADIDCLTAEGLVWRCSDCAVRRRKSMRFDLGVSDGSLTLDDVMKVVVEIRDGQKSSEKSFNEAFEAMDSRLEENTKALKDQSDKYNKICQLIESLTTENNTLRKKVTALEERIEDMEQYSRSNCVEVQGIPSTPNEDVLTIVKDVGKALDMNISDAMVDACHRLGAGHKGNHPPGIIVKFVRRIDKEEFLRRKRVKRTLSTRHIGRADDRPIFVNESLSPARRKMYALARNYQKEKNYKFLWVRNGKIFLRKEENAPVKLVTRSEDLL